MFDLIPSKDYREFIEKQKIELTDRDKATLIFNHKTSSYDERLVGAMAPQMNTALGKIAMKQRKGW